MFQFDYFIFLNSSSFFKICNTILTVCFASPQAFILLLIESQNSITFWCVSDRFRKAYIHKKLRGKEKVTEESKGNISNGEHVG